MAARSGALPRQARKGGVVVPPVSRSAQRAPPVAGAWVRPRRRWSGRRWIRHAHLRPRNAVRQHRDQFCRGAPARSARPTSRLGPNIATRVSGQSARRVGPTHDRAPPRRDAMASRTWAASRCSSHAGVERFAQAPDAVEVQARLADVALQQPARTPAWRPPGGARRRTGYVQARRPVRIGRREARPARSGRTA